MQTKLYRGIVAYGCALTVVCLLLAGSAFALTADEEKGWDAYMKAHFSDQITTNDVVRLLEMKGSVGSNVLVSEISARAFKKTDLKFSTSPADISRLKRAGATDGLMAAMLSPASVARAPGEAQINPSPTLVANTTSSPVAGTASSAGSQTNVELIIDASGSMAAKIQGRSKMDIAKQALTELLLSLPPTTNVAVRAYGHRKKDDCADLELIANFGESRSAIPAKVNNLKPLGKTPLSGSISASAKDFAGKEGQENTVILITDGEETCNADPCAAAKTAHEGGVKVKINVIGFKIEPKERAQLECIANAGGGKYVSANDAGELAAATKQVAAPVVASPEPAPAATANPASDNILAISNGGQLLVAPGDWWNAANDEKEDIVDVGYPEKQPEAVFAFKDEKPATFDRFAILVNAQAETNVREFELFAGDDSPTGTFRSIGKFTAQNAKMLKSPYQDFKFEPVTAKYLKVKLLSNYGNCCHMHIAEFKVVGKTNVEGAETTAKAPTEKKAENNILAASNGGQLLMAPADYWSAAIDGKEDGVDVGDPGKQPEAVFAFKDEKAATFDRFAVLVNSQGDTNVSEFELFAGDESPTGTFRSIGKFTVQNAKMLKSPYQEFKFEPVTAKYLKVKLLSNHGNCCHMYLTEFKLLGQPASAAKAGGESTSTSTSTTTATESKSESATAKSGGSNILAQSAGGQVLIAPSDGWSAVNDGKEDIFDVGDPGKQVEAVFAFKDEKAATVDRFAVLVNTQSETNLKGFELFVGDESPTGTFRSVGQFTAQNARMLKSPFQEFKFEPVTAKYLKVKLLSNYGNCCHLHLAEFKAYNSKGE